MSSAWDCEHCGHDIRTEVYTVSEVAEIAEREFKAGLERGRKREADVIARIEGLHHVGMLTMVNIRRCFEDAPQ